MGGNIVTGKNVRRGWNDYSIAGASLPTTGPASPALSELRDGIYAMGFVDGAVRKETYCAVHIFHDYKPGTLIYPHIHWSHKAAVPAGSVVWGLTWSMAKGHNVEAFPAAGTITLQQAAGAQYMHHIVEASTIQAIPASEPDSLIIMTVFRDPTVGGDTFADTAYLLFIDFHVMTDGFLTHEKARPFSKIIQF